MSVLIHGPFSARSHGDQNIHQHAALQYERAYAGSPLKKVLARLAGREQCLQDLHEALRARRQKSERDGGVRVVPLTEIVGSQGRACDFAPDFRPRQTHTRWRWINVATAASKGVSLPPVELLRIGDRYYVRDGHHRISVARANGQAHIDAHVTVLNE